MHWPAIVATTTMDERNWKWQLNQNAPLTIAVALCSFSPGCRQAKQALNRQWAICAKITLRCCFTARDWRRMTEGERCTGRWRRAFRGLNRKEVVQVTPCTSDWLRKQRTLQPPQRDAGLLCIADVHWVKMGTAAQPVDLNLRPNKQPELKDCDLSDKVKEANLSITTNRIPNLYLNSTGNLKAYATLKGLSLMMHDLPTCCWICYIQLNSEHLTTQKTYQENKANASFIFNILYNLCTESFMAVLYFPNNQWKWSLYS